jgi:hypothetical protein
LEAKRGFCDSCPLAKSRPNNFLDTRREDPGSLFFCHLYLSIFGDGSELFAKEKENY